MLMVFAAKNNLGEAKTARVVDLHLPSEQALAE
jgi:hypothetical protein